MGWFGIGKKRTVREETEQEANEEDQVLLYGSKKLKLLEEEVKGKNRTSARKLVRSGWPTGLRNFAIQLSRRTKSLEAQLKKMKVEGDILTSLRNLKVFTAALIILLSRGNGQIIIQLNNKQVDWRILQEQVAKAIHDVNGAIVEERKILAALKAFDNL